MPQPEQDLRRLALLYTHILQYLGHNQNAHTHQLLMLVR